MSRKVNLTVTAKIMVPVILTYNVVATVDEGVEMRQVAEGAMVGKDGPFTIEDSGIEKLEVEDLDTLADTLEDAVREYVECAETEAPTFINCEVTDSR